MSANKYQPHVLVLPEDDANSQLANGFVLEVKHDRRIQILPEAGGWQSVCERFVSEHVKGMREYPERYLVLLLDFDGQTDRADKVKEKIPEDLRGRVFLLGVQSEPEDLKKIGLGSFEDVGRTLGKECRERANDVWTHDLLRHNVGELGRLEQSVRGILF
jgi:hypothetical protein